MTSFDQKNFYVTLLSNASRDIFEQKTHADFTVKIVQTIELGTTSKWEVGVCEIPGLQHSPLHTDVSALPQRKEKARGSEREIRACEAAQISGYSKRVPDDRESAHPLRRQHYSYESVASFSQE